MAFASARIGTRPATFELGTGVSNWHLGLNCSWILNSSTELAASVTVPRDAMQFVMPLSKHIYQMTTGLISKQHICLKSYMVSSFLSYLIPKLLLWPCKHNCLLCCVWVYFSSWVIRIVSIHSSQLIKTMYVLVIMHIWQLGAYLIHICLIYWVQNTLSFRCCADSISAKHVLLKISSEKQPVCVF